jgi:hypothetical protein
MNDQIISLAPGTELEEYVIVDKLGGGGFSIVYLATSTDEEHPHVVHQG